MTGIISVDGRCCSGKTTLINTVRHMDLGFVVEEYGHTKYTGGHFPILASNLQQLMENTKFFIKLERQRHSDSSSSQRLFLDRSFLTCCAFDYAAFIETDMSIYLSQTEAMWRESPYKLMPDIMVLLEINQETFIKRLATSGKVLTHLLRDESFNQRFNQYLIKAPQQWGVKVVRIDTTSLKPEDVAESFLDLL